MSNVAAYLALVPIVGLILLAALADSKADHALLTRLEHKTDLILRRLGIDPGPDRDRIHALLRDGKTIHAVKLYRQQTGASLKEAAQAVKRMAAEDDTRAQAGDL